MKKYRNGALLGRARPMTLVILCGLLWSVPLAAQLGGSGLQAASMLSLTGVPSGAVPLEIYRLQREAQYALPVGVSILDHDDVDKVYMEPMYSDERYLHAEDGDSNRIMIRQVVAPASQFNAQTLPHSYSVLYRDTSRIYSSTGAVLFTVPMPPDQFGPLDTTGLSVLLSAVPDTLPGGMERVTAGDMEVIVDRAEGLVFMNMYDSLSQWVSREVTQYDTDTTGHHPVVYRLTVEREEAPSGACIYRVETERYSEYGIWGTGLRSGAAEPEPRSTAGVLKLSPNPVTDILRVELPELSTGGELRVRIYGLDGKVVRERRQAGGTVWEADLSGLAPGVYLVRAEGQGQSWIEKVIRR